jgi:hypothetical protein
MTKLVVDQIQKSGGPVLTLPTASPTNGQYVSSNANGELSFTAAPTATPGVPAIDPSSLPYIFAVTTGYWSDSSGNYGWSTELGQWYSNNSSYGAYMLGMATGRHDFGSSNGPNYSNYTYPPEVFYMRGTRGETTFAEDSTRYANTSDRYNYPDKMLTVVFIKNNTSADITTTAYFAGTSYWGSGYEGGQLFTMTPNAANASPSSITSLSYQSLWNYSSNTARFSTNASITVPADKTIALVLYTSGYYYANSSGYHAMYANGFYNMVSNTLTTGLSVDVPRTIKAITNPNKAGGASLAGLSEIWR